jgi:hypothetical protein
MIISKSKHHELYPDTPEFLIDPIGYMENCLETVDGKTLAAVMMKYKFIGDFHPVKPWYLYRAYKHGDSYIIRYAT